MRSKLVLTALVLSLAGCAELQLLADGGVVKADGGRGGGGQSSADGGQATAAPELTSAMPRVAGRTGRDLLVSIKGTDRNLDAVALWVRLLDAQGQPVLALDTDRDGVGDSAEGQLVLEGKKWAGEVITASATLKGLFARTDRVAQVAVTLLDATQLRSDEVLGALIDQPVVARGLPCDPLFVESRCQAGLGCRGTPAVCSEGLAPVIGRMAFYRNATGGPTILIEGTEPEDDLSTIRFQFQNAQGQPISIDSDGDGTPDLASFDQDALELAVDGTFFLRMQSGQGLDQQVPRLVATPSDSAGHTGAAKIVAPSAIPVRSTGQACDARGFDVCGPNLSCSPGLVGVANKCSNAGPMRTAQCTAASVVTPTASGARVVGVAEGGSLWDAPAGCSTYDPTGRPEGVVTLHLPSRADKVTLSTIGPGTTFDTTLYVMAGCPTDSRDALGCSDDVAGAAGASRLVLTNLPAGDYLVVVDSFSPAGGAFELTATLE